MKQEMKKTARLAVTAGLCTSLMVGGVPIEAIAAEVIADPALVDFDVEGSGGELEGGCANDAADNAVTSGSSEEEGASAKRDAELIGGLSKDSAAAPSVDAAPFLGGAPAGEHLPAVQNGLEAAAVQVLSADGVLKSGHASLEEAVAAAQSGDTIRLMSDLTASCDIQGNLSVTLDLNGMTLRAPEKKSCIQVVGGNLTVIDSTAENEPGVTSDYSSVEYRSGKIVNQGTSVRVFQGGSLALESGTIESTKGVAVFVGRVNNGSGSFVMAGGYVHAYSGAVGVINEGSQADITGGVIVSDENAPVMGNGSSGQGGTKISVSGGTLISRCTTDGYTACGLYHPQAGSLSISGGTIYADNGVGLLMRAGSAEITGGSIIASGTRSGWVGDKNVVIPSSGIVVDRAPGYPGAAKNDIVSISDDVFVSCDASQPVISVTPGKDEEPCDCVSVLGGMFSGGVFNKDLLDDERELIKNTDGTWGVVEKKVAQVGDKAYPSLVKAIAAAQNGDTVKLLEDTLSEGGAVVDAGRSLTLDLNGKTLNCGAGQLVVDEGSNLAITGGGHVKNSKTTNELASYVVLVRQGARAVVDDADITGAYCLYALGDVEIPKAQLEATGSCAIAVNGSAQVVIGSKDATVADNNKNVAVTSANNCISTQASGGNPDSRVTVYGGTFIGAKSPDNPSNPWNSGPVYWASHGTLDIRGGVFTADVATAAVFQKNGMVKVSGGTFKSKDGFKVDATMGDTSEIATEISGGSFEGTRSGIYVNASGGPIDYANKFSVKVKGGEFKGGATEHAIYVKSNAVEAAGKKPIEVSGGTFDEVVPNNCCAPGYEPVSTPDADGNFTVEVPEASRVAEVGGRAYPSLAEALEAAKNGQVVKLLKDTTENVVIEAGVSIAIDLNGNNLTAPVVDGANRKSTITVKGVLVLRDSTAVGVPVVNNDGTISYTSGSVICPGATMKPYARPVSVEPGASFTLESGRLYAEDSDGVFVGAAGAASGGVMRMKGGLIDAQEYGIGVISHSSLTVEGGLIRARNNAAVAGNGSMDPSQGDTNITIGGGVLRSENLAAAKGYIACGLYHPQSGKLMVTGGRIEAAGGVGILMRAGSAEITGGTVIGSGTASGYVGDGKGALVTSSGIVVDRAANYGGSTEVDLVRVSGTASIGADPDQPALNAILDEDDAQDKVMSVSGGTFTSEPDLAFCAPGYAPVKQSDGSYGVSTEQSYTVKHLFEKVDSEEFVEDEVLAKAETLTGKIGEETTASAKEIPGFIPISVEQKQISADGSTVVEIKYERTRHTILFDSKGGGEVGQYAGIKYGAVVQEPDDPMKEGSSFLGWYVSGTFNRFDFSKPIKEDMQLVAHWVLNAYTVTLDANGGEAIDPFEMSHGYKLSEPTAVRDGYEFIGWKDADGNSPMFPIEVTSDVALTAQWKLNGPKVVLTADKSDADAHAGDTVTLTAQPTHELDGVTYTYQWYKGRTAIEGATDATLEIYENGEYTVDVVAHDGSNSSDPVSSNSMTFAFERQGVAVSFGKNRVEKHANEIGETFINDIKLEVRAVGRVTYESSDKGVAVVDVETGEVAIKGVGEATIAATLPETDTHEGATATYKLVVTDHDEGEWRAVKPATCSEEGTKHLVCGICDEVLDTRKIDKLPHKATCVDAKEPTCIDNGYSGDKVCSACGEVLERGSIIPAIGHAWGEWKTVEKPTCIEGGREERACMACGEVESRKTSVAGHELKKIDEVPPTIDKAGTMAHYKCAVCGELYFDAEGKNRVDDASRLNIDKLEAVRVVFDDCVPNTDYVVVRLAKGGTIAANDMPYDPVLKGHVFLGWFHYDESTQMWGERFDPSAPVVRDLLIGAKWKKIDGGTGGDAAGRPMEKPMKPSGGKEDTLSQTGDHMLAQAFGAFGAGIAALGAGMFSRRRRGE